MKTKFFSAAISAMILAFSGVSATAFAEETTTENLISETATAAETTISSSMVQSETEENMTVSTETIASTIPDYYGDDYYDTSGNASLVKSERIVFDTEEMQFIAVTTKDGHVFYVLINYSAENSEDSVFFLNKVDDFDLYALLYAGDENKENITPEQALQAAENANSRVNPDSGTVTADTNETSESSEATSEEVEQPKQNNMNMNNIYPIFGGVALIGVGAAVFLMTKKKNIGKKNVVQPEPDYVEEDNEIVEEDDYPDYLDDNNNDD